MATPGTTALLPAHRPTLSWDDLPPEIYQEVVSYFADQRTTLEAIIMADCLATAEALKLYWSTAVPDNDLLAILESKPLHHRQFFADFLRNITIQFKALDEHHQGHGLQYPRLQNLTVVHDQALMGAEDRTHARIRRFVGSRLRSLEVGCQLHESQNLVPSTDNFLPRLSGCRNLRSLTLRARVRRATPGDLIAVLNNCTRLSSLRLEKHSERLVDENTISAIAAHPAVRSLQIDQHLDLHLLSLVAGIFRPFQHITGLCLCIDASAARSILPHLEKLEVLELTVFSNYGNASIFPFLRTLTTLQSVYLKLHDYVLTDHDLTYLAPLKQLESLELAIRDGARYFDTSMVRPQFFADILGSLPVLDSFALHSSHTHGDAFLIALGRNCYALKYLTLAGPFVLESLSREQGVLFPSLVVLELGRVDSTVPLSSWGGYREAWAGGIARSLLRHAPQLRKVWLREDGDGGLGGLVKEAWEEMIEERDG